MEKLVTIHKLQLTIHNDSKWLLSLESAMCAKCNIENWNGLNLTLQKSQEKTMEKYLSLESTLYSNVLYLGLTPQALYL